MLSPQAAVAGMAGAKAGRRTHRPVLGKGRFEEGQLK